MMKIGCLLLALVYSLQASPLQQQFSDEKPIPEQIQPILEILHQRLDSIINSIRNDVELTTTQSSRYLQDKKISTDQNQMELIKGLIKRINEIISNSYRKDCVSAQKELIEMLQIKSFETIQNCETFGITDVDKLNRIKFENIKTATSLKTNVGNIMKLCTKFEGFNSLLVDCLKVQAEQLSEKIYYLTFDVQNIKENASKYVEKIYQKQTLCNDYVKKQSIVEGNLILEKIQQCIKN